MLDDHRVAVKVCGVTNAEDAFRCAAAGADMIGLNFAEESVRCIEPALASEIISAIRPRFPEVKWIGVFVNQTRDFIRETVASLGLDAVQLHGDETAEFARGSNAGFIIKALRVGPQFTAETVADDIYDAVLLDTWSPRVRGGTGESFDWSIAAALRPRVKRLILAGGLTAENIAEAVRVVRPWAVDVCSGVEDSPRRKDAGKVHRFVAALRNTSEVDATVSI